MKGYTIILCVYATLFFVGLGAVWLLYNWQEIGAGYTGLFIGATLGALYYIGKKCDNKDIS